MKTKIQITGIICSMYLFAFAGNIQACDEDSDHTLISSPYYTPLISTNEGSYNDNKPAKDQSVQYDSAVKLS
jgi:hypothetical protein